MPPRKKSIEPTSSPKERVANGVIALDAKVPDWRKKINSESLKLSSHVQCVLGQVFGDYEVGLDKLGLNQVEAFDFGFNTLYLNTERALISEWISQL